MTPKKVKPRTVQSLKRLRFQLKQEAMFTGRFWERPYRGRHFRESDFDRRDKSLAFRSMSYNEDVLLINALADAIHCLQDR